MYMLKFNGTISRELTKNSNVTNNARGLKKMLLS